MIKHDSEMIQMRIFVGERDRYRHRTLYEVLVECLREAGFAGATVLKGAMGFGAHSITHTDRYLRLASELPVVIEVIEEERRIEAFLPILDEYLQQGGMVTLERVRAIRYLQSP